MQQALALALALALATPYQAVAFVELPCAMRGLMLSTGGVSRRAISRGSPALRMQMKPESETESATMAGWQRATDPETGKTFLFNEKGETKWETVTEAGQEKTTEEEVTSTFLGTKNFVSDGGDWFAKTTEADRAQRVGGDPLAPLKSGGMTRKEKEDRMVGIERDSTNWYKNQETKRSMFGRTLNPLTGSLQDIKDTDNVETLNPLEDPIFYVLVIVGAPFLLMLYAGTQCYVYALSLAFGIECPASY